LNQANIFFFPALAGLENLCWFQPYLKFFPAIEIIGVTEIIGVRVKLNLIINLFINLFVALFF